MADSLLTQMILELKINVAVISEFYKDKLGWFVDELRIAAIWVPYKKDFPIKEHSAGNGFV